MKCIPLCLAFLVLAQVTDAATAAQPELVYLLAEARSLLAGEADILEQPLDHEADIDLMMKNSGLAWRREQQDFQIQLYSLLDHYREMAPNERNALNLLVKVNNLAVNSFLDITRCNAIEPKWAVNVGNSIIDQAAVDLSAHAVPEWRPDLQADPKVASGCQ